MVKGTWHASTPPPAWWLSQGRSGGQFVEQATHLLGEAVVTHAVADRRERRAVRVAGDPVATEDRAFLAAVRSGDAGMLVCDDADALRTHELAHEVVAAAR